MQDVPADEINSRIARLLDFFRTSRADLCARIDATGKLTDEDRQLIIDSAAEALS